MIIDDVQAFSRDFINFKSFRTSQRKAKIREAYKLLTGENIRVSCSTCYIEALLLIVNSQPMASRNYELKRGVLLQAFGDASKTCTNDTLTDELAEWYLRNQPEKIVYFSKLPSGLHAVATQDEGKRKLFQDSRNFARRSNIIEPTVVNSSGEAPKVVIIPPKVYPAFDEKTPEVVKVYPLKKKPSKAKK
jgi:hypothetical protein